MASSGGDEETVKLLLYSKAKTSIRTTKVCNNNIVYFSVQLHHSLFFPILQWGRTPLHYASSRGHTKVVEMLLQAKIDINDGDKVCLPHSLCRHNNYNYCYIAPDFFFYYRMG